MYRLRRTSFVFRLSASLLAPRGLRVRKRVPGVLTQRARDLSLVFGLTPADVRRAGGEGVIHPRRCCRTFLVMKGHKVIGVQVETP